MTNCDDIQRLFLDHDFRHSSLEAAVAIAEHLRQCDACRNVTAQYDHLTSLLAPSDTPDSAAHAAPDFSAFEVGEAKAQQSNVSPRKQLPRLTAVWIASSAAILLFAISGWGLYLANIGHRHGEVPGQTVSDRTDSTSPPNLQWTRAEIDRGVAIFRNVSQTCDGRVGWIADGDRTSDLGLSAGPLPSNSKVLFVRLLMSKGMEPESKMDLVIVPGQSVQIEFPLASKNVLQYRIKTSAQSPSHLTLQANIRSPSDNETLAGLTTQIDPQPGRSVSAGRLASQSGNYNFDVSLSNVRLPMAEHDIE